MVATMAMTRRARFEARLLSSRRACLCVDGVDGHECPATPSDRLLCHRQLW
jgi:hypothetical protein